MAAAMDAEQVVIMDIGTYCRLPAARLGTTNKYYTTARVAYTHNQNAVSNSWVINHNLGFKPNVTVQDSAGTTYEGEINHTSANSLTVSFSAAFSGKAYLS